MVSFHRTHTCGDLRKEDAGQDVRLCGWVHRHRNFGGLIFIDLRDRFGITQIILDPVLTPQAHAVAQTLRFEYVIAVKGKVAVRKDQNLHIPTGQIEIFADEISVLSEAAVLPFQISDTITEVNDEIRLQYRYLDMRRGPILENLV